MKKISGFLLLSMLAVQGLVAQKTIDWNQRMEPAFYEWVFGFGFNTVNNSGAQFKELTNADHYAFGRIPFYGSLETNIAYRWKVKGLVSLNYFTDGKIFDGQTIKGKSVGGNDAGYGSMDLLASYYLLENDTYEPYLSAGMVLSHFGDYVALENPLRYVTPTEMVTFNLGFGIRIWFSEHWGLNLDALGKWGIGVGSTNHHQSHLGVLYKI